MQGMGERARRATVAALQMAWGSRTTPSRCPPPPPTAQDGDAATRLVVGNLTRNVTEDHLNEIFSTYGKLKSVELAMDKAVNLPRGFAHVEYDAHEVGGSHVLQRRPPLPRQLKPLCRAKQLGSPELGAWCIKGRPTVLLLLLCGVHPWAGASD